jgi:DNA-binding CsgD family transcriptional regulator
MRPPIKELKLTPKEQQIVKAMDLCIVSNYELSLKFGCAENTIKVQIRNLLFKLGLPSRSHLYIYSELERRKSV